MDSALLLPLFKKLEAPILEEPEKPKSKIKSEDGTVQIDEWDKMKYMER